MNSFGRTLAAVVVAAALFGYIYFVESKKEPKTEDTKSDSPKREKVFTGLDKLKVKSLALKKRGGEVIQAEKNGDVWTLVSPQEALADAGEIGTILDALQNLQTEDIVSENASDLAPFGLTEPKVRVTAVVEGAPKPFEFDLGDSVPAGSSLFGRVPGQPRLFTVSSTLENTLVKSAFDLRDRNLLKVKKDGIQSIEAVETGKVTFRIARGAKGEEDWKVVSPVATRAARWTVDSFAGLIENLRIDSIVTEDAKPADLAKYGLSGAARRLLVGLDDAKSVTLEIGKKTDDGKYYAREASSKLVALVSTALVDDLDKGLKNLRAAHLLEVATYEVAGFDVIAGGLTRTFTKSTTKGEDGIEQVVWKSKAPVKEVTQDKASEAMFTVGALDAVEFVDAPKPLPAYGLDAPALRVVFRFDAGKKEDWFEVAIKGDEAFGRRLNDTSILKLEKAKTEELIKTFTTLGS